MKLLRLTLAVLALAATAAACTTGLPTGPTRAAADAPSLTSGTGMMGGGTR